MLPSFKRLNIKKDRWKTCLFLPGFKSFSSYYPWKRDVKNIVIKRNLKFAKQKTSSEVLSCTHCAAGRTSGLRLPLFELAVRLCTALKHRCIFYILILLQERELVNEKKRPKRFILDSMLEQIRLDMLWQMSSIIFWNSMETMRGEALFLTLRLQTKTEETTVWHEGTWTEDSKG